MSGSQQIRVDRMNPCLFRHWITELTKQNKLPSQILAEEVQDTDEIPDEFPTESNKILNNFIKNIYDRISGEYLSRIRLGSGGTDKPLFHLTTSVSSQEPKLPAI